MATAAGIGVGAAETALAAGALPVVKVAMTAPIATSSPSATMMAMTPSASASSSLEILSVSRVTSVSPRLTWAPLATCQFPILAEVIDSPAAGTFISMTFTSPSTGASLGAAASSDLTAAGFPDAVAAADDSSITATTVPIATSSPSCTRILSVPSASAVRSLETLSVSIVSTVSPLMTASPSCLCQRATLAEVIDSPTFGILTSVAIKFFVC